MIWDSIGKLLNYYYCNHLCESVNKIMPKSNFRNTAVLMSLLYFNRRTRNFLRATFRLRVLYCLQFNNGVWIKLWVKFNKSAPEMLEILRMILVMKPWIGQCLLNAIGFQGESWKWQVNSKIKHHLYMWKCEKKIGKSI